MPANHPAHLIAVEVLEKLYDGNSPYFVGVGGSVPVIPLFLRELGVYTINFGWSIGDEQLHAPNEFFRLSNFRRGQRGFAMLLEALSDYRH